jgi:glycosyltransferase involved in cell wall biosynthesis
MRAVLDHAGALIIGARSFAEEVEQNLGVPPDRFTIIPGAIDLERFHPREGWRAGDLLDDSRPILLYHGRVDRRKGALDLLDAYAILLTEGRDLRLVVSGIGPDSEAVAARVGELGLADHVELRGYATYGDAPAAYRRADLFLSPTYAEGFSNTILEAMACGLPIVSTRAVGVVDCLRDGENGLLVEPGDARAIAAATARLLDDAGLRTRLATRAREEVQELYAWPVIARRIEGVYRDLLGTEPDNAWSVEGPPDMACRFRAAPHLL